MQALFEYISLIPSTGVLLGASVSLACWVGLLYWLLRLSPSSEKAWLELEQIKAQEDPSDVEPSTEEPDPDPRHPRKSVFHEARIPRLTWEGRVGSEWVWLSPSLRDALGFCEGQDMLRLDELRDRIHPDDLDEVCSVLQSYLQRQVKEILPFRIAHSDGRYLWFRGELFIEALAPPTGEVIYGEVSEVSEAMVPSGSDGEHASRWEMLLDASEDGFWEWPQMDQDAQWWSNGFFRLLGLETNEVVPGFKALMRLVHPSDRRCFDAGLKQTVLNTTRFQIEARLRLRNGSFRWFSVVFVCERGEEAGRERITGSIRDIQAQREARIEREDTDELFRSVFERTTVGLALIDKDGFVLHANPALSRMLRVEADQVRGVEWRSIVHSDDWPKCESIYRRIFGGKEDYLQIENRYRAAGNGSFDALTGLSRLSHSFSNGARVIAHIQDVSALKQAERTANEANMCKSQFLAQMSHEIRTPLNGVMGMTQLVLGTELSAEQRDFLVTAQESSEQLLTVINDILDLSKIEAGRLEICEVEFCLRRGLLSMLAPLSLKAHEKGLEFVLDMDPALPDEFKGDWARVQQILINLIGNAIKFTESGEVVLRVGLERVDLIESDEAGKAEAFRHRAQVRFSVTDTGIGIPRDQQQRIFGAFNQVDPSLSRGHQGTGLGLAISADLAGLLGGTIDVTSEPGSGSQFEVCLGLLAKSASIRLQPWSSEHDLTRLSVLLVDDCISARAAHARLLRGWGIQVSSVGDLESAKKELEEGADNAGFDLLLIDSKYREEAERCCLIPSDLDGSKSIHVGLMVSAVDRAAEVARCKEAGYEDYFLKPMDPRRLLQFMERLLGVEVIAHDDKKPESEAVEKPAGYRFLVAEDSPISRKVVVNLLVRQGHQVVTAANGMEAVIAVGKGRFDAVFMDVNMPDMDGLQATNLIREREQGSERHVWIIALTAQALEGDRQRCLTAGMDDYVSKPIRWPELWDAIQRIPVRNGNRSGGNGGGVLGDEFDVLESRRLVELALDEVVRGRRQIGESLTHDSAMELKKSSHRLKGVLRQCQMPKEAELAGRLEAFGREGCLTPAPEVYADLVRRLNQFDLKLQERRRELLRQEKAPVEA